MAMHLHSAWVGKRPARIFVTAGGSGNRGLLTVIADVFGVGVQTWELKGVNAGSRFDSGLFL